MLEKHWKSDLAQGFLILILLGPHQLEHDDACVSPLVVVHAKIYLNLY